MDFSEVGMEIRVRRKVDKQLADSVNPTDYQKDDDPQVKTKGVKVKAASPYTIQNVIWLISSIAVFYYTDFARAVMYDPRIKRSWFYIGVILISIHIGIAFFLIVYLSMIKKMSTDEWDIHYPAAIPIATASFAFGSLCVTIGLWPVWGVFTMPILFTQLMAVVVLVAMLPPF